MTTFSVALCTYNGQAHITAQLESIARQTLLPAELVVCDDRSSDDTLAVVAKFAQRAPFPVRWTINPENLGSSRNFSQAISNCREETIVLADQDDVWREDKLETLAGLLSDSDIGMAFSNAEIVDDELRSLGFQLWDSLPQAASLEQTAASQRFFERLLRGNVVTGATMAFRARFRELVLPVPASWIHDEWITLWIAAVAPCRATAQPLIKYRQHARQQIGAWRFSVLEAARQLRRGSLKQTDLQARARDLQFRADQLARQGNSRVAPERLADLREKAAHFLNRESARQATVMRLPRIAGEVWRGRYHRYSLGWLTIARDLLAV